MNRVLSTINFF